MIEHIQVTNFRYFLKIAIKYWTILRKNIINKYDSSIGFVMDLIWRDYVSLTFVFNTKTSVSRSIPITCFSKFIKYTKISWLRNISQDSFIQKYCINFAEVLRNNLILYNILVYFWNILIYTFAKDNLWNILYTAWKICNSSADVTVFVCFAKLHAFLMKHRPQ